VANVDNRLASPVPPTARTCSTRPSSGRQVVGRCHGRVRLQPRVGRLPTQNIALAKAYLKKAVTERFSFTALTSTDLDPTSAPGHVMQSELARRDHDAPENIAATPTSRTG